MCFFSVYNKFKFKSWAKMSPGKRQIILEKVEKKQSKKLKRPTLPVVINHDPNWNCYGAFTVSANGKKILYLSISLIEDVSLRYHALETILHEGRHAYQFEQITKKKIGFFNFKAKKWKENYSGYINSAEDKLVYSLQPVERDAQKYSIKFMEGMRFKYRNEEDYHNTMKSMIFRYEQTVKDAKNEMGLFYKSKMNKKIKNKQKKYKR